jgi:hypothetical protein
LFRLSIQLSIKVSLRQLLDLSLSAI